MKYADISGLTEKELAKRAKDLRAEMFEANMKNALGQLANPMTIREMRRDIARLQTALHAQSKGEKPAKAVKKKTSGQARGKKTKSAAKG